MSRTAKTSLSHCGPRLLADEVGALIRPALSKKQGAIGQIYLHWAQIVGRETSVRAHPLKLKYTGRKATSACLLLAVKSVDALLIEYAAPQICSRINHYLGYEAVSQIQLVHNVSARALPVRGPRNTPKLGVERINKTLQSIDDDNLKEALRKLGSVLP